MPDEYLAGLSTETTITAAELCTAGMWERVSGGYRVLSWEAVQVCLDRVREIKREDPRALAWEREREAQALAQMATAMVCMPGPVSAHRARDPGTHARRMGAVAQHGAGSIVRQREPGQWYFRFKASLPPTATASSSTPAVPAGSPRRSGLPRASPRFTWPGFTTMQDSARTVALPTATSTGTYPKAATVTALVAAWGFRFPGVPWSAFLPVRSPR